MPEQRISIRCPRCEQNLYTPYKDAIKEGDFMVAEYDPRVPAPPPPALSRTTREEGDEPVYVCSECGQEEAMQDAFEGGATPQSGWPVAVIRLPEFGMGTVVRLPSFPQSLDANREE